MQMTLLKTLTGNVTNNGPKQQKMHTTGYSESYKKTTSITTIKSTETLHENSSDRTVGFEIGPSWLTFEAEFSVSHIHRSLSSSNVNKTETKTVEITVTAPPQEIVVDPNSYVSVTSKVFSFTETATYLVDFHLDSYVNYFCEMHNGNYISFIDIARYENDINAIPFDTDDVKIVCSNGECLLKDVPVVLQETGYHTDTIFGVQEPIWKTVDQM